MRSFTISFTVALAVGSAASGLAGTFVKSIDLAPRVRPESITRAWGKFYVSIQGPASDTTTTDGEIVQLDVASGTATPFVAPGKLVNPRGLAFAGDTLYVTDTTVVWKIDKEGHVAALAEAAAFPTPPGFLNDAAPSRDGRAVYVTDMGPGRSVQRDPSGVLWPTDSAQAEAIPTAARVYRIDLKDGKVTDACSPTRKILVTNGIAESKSGPPRLLALDFFNGSVVSVDLDHDTKEILATGPFRGGDGIEQAKDGTIFVSSFENGKVWRMDAQGENVEKLFDVAADEGKPGRQTLADLTLDEDAGRLYVPDTANARIVVLKTR
jgi:sugar lactone lactonase YvrE